ncbi:MAG: hypothetical protein V4606_03095 [Patescibacteria group bacterium]
MSEQMVYLGETTFIHEGQNFRRTWHMWVDYDDEGTLVKLHYGISTDIRAANRITKQQCELPVQNYLWSVAELRLKTLLIRDPDEENGDDDDAVVIPLFPKK